MGESRGAVRVAEYSSESRDELDQEGDDAAAIGLVLDLPLLREGPRSRLWAIGTLVGFNVLFCGLAMISIGSAARKIPRGVS